MARCAFRPSFGLTAHTAIPMSAHRHHQPFSALADGDLGHMGVVRGSGASSLTAGGWLLPVAGALLLSGCIPRAFIRPDFDSCPCAASTAANSGTSTDQPKSEQAQPPEKSNKPRTLPQAVCAYLHC